MSPRANNSEVESEANGRAVVNDSPRAAVRAARRPKPYSPQRIGQDRVGEILI